MYYKMVYDGINKCYWLVNSDVPYNTEWSVDSDIPAINDRETAKILVEALNDYYAKLSR